MPSNRPRSHARRTFRGMTLLELVLSLSLSALLLMAISMALHIHWRAFDVKRSRVEEAQLASAILRNISDDIRGTLKFEPPNLEGLNLSSLASNALGSAAAALTDSGNGGDGTTPTDNSGGGSNQQQQPGNTNGGGTQNPMQPSNSNSNNNSQTPGGGTTGSGSSTGTGGTSTGGTSSGDMSSGDSSTGATAEDETTAESGPSVVVGLYGSSSQLQFDISRLPRVDQYQSQEAGDGSMQIPSDIKTVVYFLAEEQIAAATGSFATAASTQPSTSGTGRGLMRAESDRAVSAFGELNGSSDSLFSAARLLAAEVTSVQFQYFDGTEWLTEWNSDDAGGLPTAIEVLLTIDSPHSSQSVTSASTLTQPVDSTTQPTYRMVVHLPVGGISPSTEESTELTDSTDPASSGSDTSGTSGTGGTGGTNMGGGGTTP